MRLLSLFICFFAIIADPGPSAPPNSDYKWASESAIKPAASETPGLMHRLVVGKQTSLLRNGTKTPGTDDGDAEENGMTGV